MKCCIAMSIFLLILPSAAVILGSPQKDPPVPGRIKIYGLIAMSVAYSPDGKTVAAGNWDGSIEIWNTDPGHPTVQYKLLGHQGGVLCLAFSLDGKTLASGSWDNTIKVWDMKSRKEYPVEGDGHTGPVASVAFNSDGSILASGSWDKTVKLWGVTPGQASLKIKKTLRGHTDAVLCVAFKPEPMGAANKILASGGEDGMIKFWNVGDYSAEDVGNIEDTVRALVFRPDGKVLVSSGPDKTIWSWNTDTKKVKAKLKSQNAVAVVTALAFNGTGEILLSSYKDGTIRMWDGTLEDWEQGPGGRIKMTALEGHDLTARSLSFSRDGKHFVSGGDEPRVKLGLLQTGELRSLEGHKLGVICLAAPENGGILASGSLDNTIKLWEPARGKEITQPAKTSSAGGIDQTSSAPGKDSTNTQQHKDRVASVVFNLDGTLMISGSYDKTIRLWDTSSQANRASLANSVVLQASLGQVNAVAYNPGKDSTTLASAVNDKSIQLWDIPTGKVKGSLEGHSGYVTSLQFSPIDGTTLASGSWDKTVKVWNVETKVVIRNFEGHSRYVTSVAFSPDGKTIASGSDDKTIRLWNLETGEGRILATLSDTVRSVAFSPDGNKLVSGSDDNAVVVWDIKSGHRIDPPLTGHNASVQCVTFLSPHLLASGSLDKTIKVWLFLPNP